LPFFSEIHIHQCALKAGRVFAFRHPGCVSGAELTHLGPEQPPPGDNTVKLVINVSQITIIRPLKAVGERLVLEWGKQLRAN
jgi:hypothetical protein